MNRSYLPHIILLFIGMCLHAQSEKISEGINDREIKNDSLVQSKEVSDLAEDIWLDEVWNAVPEYNPLLLVDEDTIEKDTLSDNSLNAEILSQE